MTSENKRQLLRAYHEGRISLEEMNSDKVKKLFSLRMPIILMNLHWGKPNPTVNNDEVTEAELMEIYDLCKKLLVKGQYVYVTSPKIISTGVPLANSENDVIL